MSTSAPALTSACTQFFLPSLLPLRMRQKGEGRKARQTRQNSSAEPLSSRHERQWQDGTHLSFSVEAQCRGVPPLKLLVALMSAPALQTGGKGYIISRRNSPTQSPPRRLAGNSRTHVHCSDIAPRASDLVLRIDLGIWHNLRDERLCRLEVAPQACNVESRLSDSVCSTGGERGAEIGQDS